MRIYWYAPWPDDRPWTSLELAERVAGEADEVVVQALQPTTGRAETRRGGARVVGDLPVVSPAVPWTPRWLLDRARVVIGRATRRNRAIRELEPDVVHLQLLSRFTDAWMMPHGSVVATVHDVLPHHARLPGRLERALLAKVYLMLDGIVVHHQAVGEQLETEFGVARDRIRCIPLVIAPNRHPPVARDLSSPTVLFFGAFRRNKGIAALCEAIALVDDERVRFRFAGRGDADVEQVVRQLAGRDRRVSADVGYVPNDVKDELFRKASLVVLPYTTFTSQSAVLGDAYAGGTPVVVADVGALGRSVRDDGTGWVLPSTRPEDIAETIRRSLLDVDGWERRARRCAVVAAERSVDLVAAWYRELYADLDHRRAR